MSGYVGPSWLSSGVRSCAADLSDRRAEFEATTIWGASDGDSESGGDPCAPPKATALDDMAESADEDALRRSPSSVWWLCVCPAGGERRRRHS